MSRFADLPLRHFSVAQAIFPLSEEQRPDTETGAYEKPKGLWLSVEGGDEVFGWSDWCRAESCDFLGAFEHAVTLADQARILLIGSDAELIAFHRHYAIEQGTFNARISWSTVADEYQGILITPYLWSARLGSEAGWYYTWDCASGCIWDASAIGSVALLGKHAVAVS